MMIRRRFGFLWLLAPLVFTSQAQASGILDFGVLAPTTGAISFAGGTAPLIGSGIQVDNVVGLGTPANAGLSGQRNCLGCILSFTTGAATAGTWSFGPGGSISLVGGIDLNNNGVLDGTDVPAGTTLLSGSFTGAATVMAFVGGFRVVGAAFVDTKDPALAAFYGLPGGASVPYAGGLNVSFIATGSVGNAFRSRMVLSGDIANQRQVDLPDSLLLLGAGLTGFAWLRIRAKKAHRTSPRSR